MKTKKEDILAISSICNRAMELGIFEQKIDLLMDINHWHQEKPIDLEKLAGFDDFNFMHDVVGIYRHFDRVHKVCGGCFEPRAAAYDKEEK